METFDSFGSTNPSPASPPPLPPQDQFLFTSSSDLGKLFAALAKAQGEMKPAYMDMVNPHFGSRYASITSCQEAYREPLAKNELSLMQQVYSDGSWFFIRSVLGHSSGQWVASTFKLLIDKQNMQGLGSAITYGRRYGINSLVGVVDTEDDDGNQAVGGAKGPVQTNPQPRGATIAPKVGSSPQAPPPSDPNAPPSEKQLKRLFAIAETASWTHEQVKLYLDSAFKITSTKELTRAQYDALCETIQTKPYQKAMVDLVGKG